MNQALFFSSIPPLLTVLLSPVSQDFKKKYVYLNLHTHKHIFIHKNICAIVPKIVNFSTMETPSCLSSMICKYCSITYFYASVSLKLLIFDNIVKVSSVWWSWHSHGLYINYLLEVHAQTSGIDKPIEEFLSEWDTRRWGIIGDSGSWGFAIPRNSCLVFVLHSLCVSSLSWVK